MAGSPVVYLFRGVGGELSVLNLLLSDLINYIIKFLKKAG